METTWVELERQARAWIVEAGDAIKQALHQPFHIDAKSGPNDLVTDVDKSTESFFYDNIVARYPDHHFLGEEGIADQLDTLEGIVWIVDPIDGTMNFVHQKRNFAISIGIYENGKGKVGLVYDVMSGELFHAIEGVGFFVNDRKQTPAKGNELAQSIIGINGNWLVKNNLSIQPDLVEIAKACRGTRSYGSAALEMAYVASGLLDAYISPKLSPWDYAGGAVLLQEAGCKTTRFNGEALSLLERGSIVAAKPALHETLVTAYLHKGENT